MRSGNSGFEPEIRTYPGGDTSIQEKKKKRQEKEMGKDLHWGEALSSTKTIYRPVRGNIISGGEKSRGRNTKFKKETQSCRSSFSMRENKEKRGGLRRRKQRGK